MTLELEKYELNTVDVLRDTHAQTAIRLASVLAASLAMAIRAKLTADGTPVDESVFKRFGKYETLSKRIDGAHSLGLIDEVTKKDAHLLRDVRNAFSHSMDPLHFDSKKIVALVEKMSTFQAAENNQQAFLQAGGNLSSQLGTAIKGLLKP